MPPKESNPTQIFFKTENGEYQPMRKSIEMSLEPTNISGDDYMEYFKGGEFEFEMTEEMKRGFAELIRPYLKVMDKVDEILKRTFHCNNWRKMHHLPIIRRKWLIK